MKNSLLKNNIHKITAKDFLGRDAFFYLLVNNKVKFETLKKAGKVGTHNLKDYGNVIISGFGKTTPEHVKRMLKEQYGYED